MAGILNMKLKSCRRFTRESGGAVAAEMAIVAGFLAILIAQVLDFGWMAYSSVQVRTAAQAAAAEAASICQTQADLPATVNCEANQSIDLQAKMEEAANRVSIGDSATRRVVIAEPSEGYFCHDASANNALVEVGDLNNPPADCSAYGSAEAPGNYIYTTATYNFSPMFPGLSVASVIGNPITADGWMRLD